MTVPAESRLWENPERTNRRLTQQHETAYANCPRYAELSNRCDYARKLHAVLCKAQRGVHLREDEVDVLFEQAGRAGQLITDLEREMKSARSAYLERFQAELEKHS